MTIEAPGTSAVCWQWYAQHGHNPWTSDDEGDQDWAAEMCLECPVFGKCQLYVEEVKKFPGGAVGVYAGEIYPRRNAPRKPLTVDELFAANRKESDAVPDVRTDGSEGCDEALRAVGDRRDGAALRQGEQDPARDRAHNGPRLVDGGQGAEAPRHKAASKRSQAKPRSSRAPRGLTSRDEAARRAALAREAIERVLVGGA